MPAPLPPPAAPAPYVAAQAPESPSEARRFDISTRPLSAAIEVCAVAVGVTVLYDRPRAAEPNSAPMHGAMTPQTALRALLAGPGLEARSSDRRNAVLALQREGGVPAGSGLAVEDRPGDDLPRLALDAPRVTGGPVVAAPPSPGPTPARKYAEAVRWQLQEALDADPILSRGEYQAVLRVGIGRDGRAQQVRLAQTSGDPQRDRRIEVVARALTMEAPPPPGFPSAMLLRVRSRVRTGGAEIAKPSHD